MQEHNTAEICKESALVSKCLYLYNTYLQMLGRDADLLSLSGPHGATPDRWTARSSNAFSRLSDALCRMHPGYLRGPPAPGFEQVEEHLLQDKTL